MWKLDKWPHFFIQFCELNHVVPSLAHSVLQNTWNYLLGHPFILFLERRHLENTKNPCYVWSSEGSWKNVSVHGLFANTISLFLEEIVGFVHDVSELHTGKTVQYYTMMLQTPDKNFRTVSYRKDLKDGFPKTEIDRQWRWQLWRESQITSIRQKLI